jgi:hypothetical protein
LGSSKNERLNFILKGHSTKGSDENAWIFLHFKKGFALLKNQLFFFVIL